MRATPWLLAGGLALTAGAVPVSFAADSKPAARFTAFAIDLNGRAGRNTATVDIVINRWSTEAERSRLWGLAVAAYPPYQEYQAKTTRKIPIFVAEPAHR